MVLTYAVLTLATETSGPPVKNPGYATSGDIGLILNF